MKTRDELKIFRKYFKTQIPGLIIVLGTVLLFLAINSAIGDIPFYERVLDFFEKIYESWGLWFAFFAGIIEGTVVLNWYFPGVTIVILGIILGRAGSVPLWEFLSIAYFGFFLSFTLDYVIGRYGLYKILTRIKFFKNRLKNAKDVLEKRAALAFFLWYIHPQSGTLVATAAGVLHYPFWKFMAFNISALLVWGGIWTIVVYLAGGLVLEIIDDYFYHMGVAALVMWLLFGYNIIDFFRVSRFVALHL